MSPLNQEQAASARDALSKAIYGRTFTWLVNKINDSLAYKVWTCSVLNTLSAPWLCKFSDRGLLLNVGVWRPHMEKA